jgi:Rad3-related DNA helicase
MNIDGQISIEDWDIWFPSTPEGVRPEQERAINFIIHRLIQGDCDVFFEGPVGSGKSFVAWVIAQYFNAEFGWKTRIFVPNKHLQGQYMSDFARFGMRLLKSSKNYDCPEFMNCAAGRGQEDETPKAELLISDTSHQPPEKKRLCRCDDCPYLIARTEFECGAIGVTNSAYGLTCAHYGHPFVSGDLAIFDEGHNLESEICSKFEVTMRCDLSIAEPEQGREVEWLHSVYHPLLVNAINRLSAQLAASGSNSSVEHRLKTYQHLEFSIRFITDQNVWLVNRTWPRLVFEPLWATKIAPPLLAKLAPRRIYMSGTFLDFDLQQQLLGLIP